MNFISLILHGLSAISVFSEILLVRILLTALGVGAFLLAWTGFLFFTQNGDTGQELAMMTGFIVVVLLQILLTCVFSIFLTLNYRTQRSFIPYIHYKDYLLKHDKLHT